MTREEHLLTIVAEECMEVAHRATKALRFGLDQTEIGQEYTNLERMMHEFEDLLGAMRLLVPESGFFTNITKHQQEKLDRIEKFLILSKELGKLDD